MWTRYFKVVGIKPGEVVVQGMGKINLANKKMTVHKVKKAFESGCRYLEPTPEGYQKFYAGNEKLPQIPKVAQLKENIPAPPKELTAGEIIQASLEKGILEKSGTWLKYEGKNFRQKQVMEDEELMDKLRNSL